MFTDTITTVTCTIAGKNITIPVRMTSDDTANDNVVTITVDPTPYAANVAVGDTDSDVGLALTTNVNATASFIWSDLSAQSHAISTTDWTTDYLVKNLPTPTQNLVK